MHRSVSVTRSSLQLVVSGVRILMAFLHCATVRNSAQSKNLQVHRTKTHLHLFHRANITIASIPFSSRSLLLSNPHIIISYYHYRLLSITSPHLSSSSVSMDHRHPQQKVPSPSCSFSAAFHVSAMPGRKTVSFAGARLADLSRLHVVHSSHL